MYWVLFNPQSDQSFNVLMIRPAFIYLNKPKLKNCYFLMLTLFLFMVSIVRKLEWAHFCGDIWRRLEQLEETMRF